MGNEHNQSEGAGGEGAGAGHPLGVARRGVTEAEARPCLVVITGPTAVGKTALGIELALRFGGEVINADSRYFYRGFDIGVAKPDLRERRGVPHHLIDILPPDGAMSLATFQDLAMGAIADVTARHRVPFLVGGTPLYVNAVVEGWRIPRVAPDPALRESLEAEAKTAGTAALLERLRAVDPVAAARSAGNLRRIVRALEVYAGSGVPMSAQEGKGPPPYATLELVLAMERVALYRAIDARVDEQIARGLVEEVRRLLAAGVAPGAPAMTSLGYRQLLPFLRGEATLAEAVARIKADTHRYVRHQETWLRRKAATAPGAGSAPRPLSGETRGEAGLPGLAWLDVGEHRWQERAATLVEWFLTRSPGSA